MHKVSQKHASRPLQNPKKMPVKMNVQAPKVKMKGHSTMNKKG